MGAHRLRTWVASSAVLALGAVPVLVTQLDSGIAGATVTSDAVTYAQSSTSSSFSFVPGNGSPPTTQAISPTGTCKTPTTTSAPLLALSAVVYKSPVSGVPYTGPSSAGTVGTSRGRTGVCDLPPPWAINRNESLLFALGSNPLVAGRIISEAKVPLVLIADDDEGDTSSQFGQDGGSSTTSVTLLERRGTTLVGTQSVVVPAGDGDGDMDDTVTADTGSIAGGFTTLELRVTTSTSETAVSVVSTSVLTLLQLPQTITFTNTPPSAPLVGDAYTVTATGGGSGNPVLFSVDATSTSGCTVGQTTGLVTLNGPAGTCVIDANQAGNATYAPAPQAQQAVTVGRIPQTVTFTNTPPSAPIVGDTYTVTATGGGSGNPVLFSVDATSTSGCTVGQTTGLVTLTGPAGSCVIDANQAGNTSYLPAPQAQQTVTAGLAPQEITFTSTPPATPVVGDTYTVTATGGGSGNPVTFTIDGSSTSGCVVGAGGLVTFDAPTGSCVIDANQAGNSSYSAAPQVQQDITVVQVICGQQTISTQSTDGTTGQVTASFTFQDFNGQPAPPSVCKSYTAFTASADNQVEGLTGNQTVQFQSNPLATAHVTSTISWAVQSFCTPDGSGNTTQCPPTYVSFDDGATWHVQTYCSSAQSAGIPWCTTSRSYAYSSQGTQITETWDGYGDPVFHHA
jgi:hypothetical protein